MMELRIVQGSLLKKIIKAIKELQNNVYFHCSPHDGFSLHAMDFSQVASVELLLPREAFEYYRCDRNISMGMNLDNVATILKCSGDDDIISIKADDGSDDTVTFLFKSPNKISYFEMNLMEYDKKEFRIREMQYHATVRMPSAEFARICKYLSSIGDHVMISVTMEGVRFSTRGDIGIANVLCKQHINLDKPEESTVIEMNDPEPETVALSFESRFTNSFTEATPLSRTVTISLSNKLSLAVEYKIAEMGYVRFRFDRI